MKVLNSHRVQLCSWQATHRSSWLGLRYVLMVDIVLYKRVVYIELLSWVTWTLRYKFFAHPMMSTVNSLTQKSTYEFTKRKRWPDLLITGLVDSVLFILSPSCIVLYVGTAVNELLGWRDVDLVDLDFIKLINRTLQINPSNPSNS